VRAAVQLLLVQACGEVHTVHAARMPGPALAVMLDTLEALSAHARRIDDDMTLRRALAFAQAEDQVCSWSKFCFDGVARALAHVACICRISSP